MHPIPSTGSIIQTLPPNLSHTKGNFDIPVLSPPPQTHTQSKNSNSSPPNRMALIEMRSAAHLEGEEEDLSVGYSLSLWTLTHNRFLNDIEKKAVMIIVQI